MKVRELIEKLNNFDPEKPVKITTPSWDNEKLCGLSHSDINVLVGVQDELWLVDDVSTEFLDSMNWQDYYK